MDDEVRDRIMPGCLIGTAAASCFFDLVDGERGSRNKIKTLYLRALCLIQHSKQYKKLKIYGRRG